MPLFEASTGLAATVCGQAVAGVTESIAEREQPAVRENNPGGTQPAPTEARLPPELGSVVRARRLVEDTLVGWGLPQSVRDDAMLVISELVTNAVIHARTPIIVNTERLSPGVRMVVTDHSDQAVMLPYPERRVEPAGFFDDPDDVDLDAILEALPSTGRGMSLVDAVSDEWGTQPVPTGGKQVWAIVGTQDPGGAGTDLPDPAVAFDAEPQRNLDDRSRPATTDRRGVRLIAVPARLIAESDQEFDALVRGLQVSALGGSPARAVRAMAAEATELLDELNPLKAAGHDAVLDALARGDRVVDLDLPTAPPVGDALTRLTQFLRQVTEARREEMLFTLRPPHEVVEFRRWYASEVRRQEAGLPPEPCPFAVIPAHARPTRRRVAELGRRRRGLLDRLRRELQSLSDRSEVVERVFERSLSELGAGFAAVYVVDPEAAEVVCLGRTGSRRDAAAWSRFPLWSPNPCSETVRTGRTVVVRTAAERHARYPALPATEAGMHHPALATVPMVMGDSLPSAEVVASGSLTIGFAQARDFSDDDLSFLEHLAELVAAALDAAD